MTNTNGSQEGYSSEEDNIYWEENEQPKRSNWVKWGVIIVSLVYAVTMIISIIINI